MNQAPRERSPGRSPHARIIRVVPCLLLVMTTGSAPALAGGFTQTTFGGRRTGMLANMGRPDDLTALFHNPAGLADQRGIRLHLSTALAFVQQDIELKAHDSELYPVINPAGCGEPGVDPCPWPVGADGYYQRSIEPESTFGVLPYLGLGADLGWLSSKLRDVVVSLAVCAPNFYGAYLPEDAPSAYNIIGGYFLVLASTAGVGWRINRYASVGASLSYHYMTLTMAQKLSVAAALTPRGQRPSEQAKASQSLLGDILLNYEGTDHGLGWRVGLLLNPWPAVGIGLGYSGATPARFEGDLSFEAVREDLKDQDLGALMARMGYKMPTGLTVEMVIPHSVEAGINVDLTSWLEAGLDIRVWFYNLYDRQTLIPVYDASQKGTEPMTEESLSRDKDYHVSYQVAGGLLVRPWPGHRELELMAGTAYDRSPIPGKTMTLDNPSSSHVKVAVGGRMRLGEHWLVCLTYFLNIFLEMDIRNSQTSPPTNVRGGGFTHSPGIELEYIF